MVKKARTRRRSSSNNGNLVLPHDYDKSARPKTDNITFDMSVREITSYDENSEDVQFGMYFKIGWTEDRIILPQGANWDMDYQKYFDIDHDFLYKIFGLHVLKCTN